VGIFFLLLRDPSMTNLRRLPMDLYRPIISYLEGNHDLLTLCVTSREWWFESHRALFRHVKLRGGIRLKSWTKAVLNSPRTAAFTRAITLPTRATLTRSDKVALAEALSRVVNLQELYISHTMTLNSLKAYLDPWVLQCCSKQLRVFHSELQEFEAGFEAYSLFFRKHSQISRLFWAGSAEGSLIDSRSLCYLTTVHLRDWKVLNVLIPRLISRIRIVGVVMSRDEITLFAACLSQFKDTLTHLSVRVQDAYDLRHDFSVVDAVYLLGKSIPKLNFLNISGDTILVRLFSFLPHLFTYPIAQHFGSDSETQVDELVEAISTLKELDTVMLDSQRPYPRRCTSIYRGPIMTMSSQKFVECVMEPCPRLNRIALGPLGIQCWQRDANGSSCYVRRPDGHVEFEGFNIITSDSWAIM
jgi:hypothetical protein